MDDVRVMGCLNACRYLRNDRGDFVDRQWGILFRVALEYLAFCPLNGEEMKAVVCLADLDGLHHVRVSYSGAVFRFADETRNSGFVLA